MTPADLDVAVCVVFVGTTGRLPEGTTTEIELLSFLRGCSVAEAGERADALDLLHDLREAAPGIAARGGTLNWPRTISRLAGWDDEHRAELALEVGRRCGLLGSTEVDGKAAAYSDTDEEPCP